MQFTVTNNNMRYSFTFWPDFVTIRVEDLQSGIFVTTLDIPIQVWQLVDVQRNQFRDYHSSTIPITENQQGSMEMYQQVDMAAGYVPFGSFVNDNQFQAGSIEHRFAWENEGSQENPIEVDSDTDSGFVNDLRPALAEIQNSQQFN